MLDEKIKSYLLNEMPHQNFDVASVGVIDFSKNEFYTFEISELDRPVLFDLASLTKPLTLSLASFILPDIFDEKLSLLLNHQSGLPAWGRLSHHNWKEQLLNYQIKKSETLYSDFGALRLMLEIEKRSKSDLKNIVSPLWDKSVSFWKDIEDISITVCTGTRNNRKLFGEVHDDNCFVINEFTSHAGLFSTNESLCRSILNWENEYNLLSSMKNELEKTHDRFVRGWDTVTDANNTLAGTGASEMVFGHLGFTGTSIWIDSKMKIGWTLLTNATQNYWYEREGLSKIRKEIGKLIWQLV